MAPWRRLVRCQIGGEDDQLAEENMKSDEELRDLTFGQRVLQRLLRFTDRLPPRPPPSVRQQLREWMCNQRGLETITCAMPPMTYWSLVDHLEQTRFSLMDELVGSHAHPHGRQTLESIIFPSGDREDGLMADGIWCYPDPTVTEFTAR